ncbi:MAG: hypothetical protein NT033_03460, partial [Candidatus Omnitrophica bacterium]|nr:hypothetical protein [Candidatus Omnitrophota bacterium]
VEEIIRRTKWLNDVGLPWSAFFIVGFPFETIEDLKLTEELMNKIQPTFISLNHFTPYPGTEIYKEYYLNANIKFRDLFQINRNNYLSVDDKTKDYMDRIFANVDAHNQKNNLQLKTAGAGGVNERSK